MMIYRQSIISDLNAAYITISLQKPTYTKSNTHYSVRFIPKIKEIKERERERERERKDLEIESGVLKGVEVAKAKVCGGAMAAEGVEFSAADQNQLRDAEGGGAPGERAHVVPLRYVVHQHIALYLHFSLFR